MGTRRSTWRAAAVVLVVGVLAAASVAFGPAPRSSTDVTGRVALEAPTPEAVVCAWRRGGEAAQGVLGWVVELAPWETRGRTSYHLTTEGAVEDLDLTFFDELPSCAAPPRITDSMPRSGPVPSGARWAVLGRWSADVDMGYSFPPTLQRAEVRPAAGVSFRFRVRDVFDRAPLAALDREVSVSQVPVGRPGLTVALSRARFAAWTASHVVLTRMDVFADSLAAAPLVASGPLLGVWPDRLPWDVVEELRRVLPDGGTVYLLGGPTAIAEAVAAEVEGMGYETRRLAGRTRIQTALAVADEVVARGDSDQVALARADGHARGDASGWADSVAGGAWAAAHGVPVLLTETDELHPDVAAWLRRVEPTRTVLLGGEEALTSRVARAVPNAHRVAGADRAETAAAIARQLWGPSPDGRARHVVVNGWSESGWLWGLPAAGASADAHAPMLLVSGDTIPDATAQAIICERTHVVASGTSTDPAVGITAGVVEELERLAERTC